MNARLRPHTSARALGALLTGLALFGGAATAQVFSVPKRPMTFTPPSAAQCASTAFLMRASDGQHDYCRNLIGAELAGDQAEARREGRLSTVTVSGVSSRLGRLSSVVTATEIEPRLQGVGNMVTPIGDISWLGYMANEQRVDSCEEYVYERFYTVSRFLTEAHLKRSGREVYALAFAPNGMTNIGHLMATANPASTAIARYYGGYSTLADQPYDLLPLLPEDGRPDLGIFAIDLPKSDFFALSAAERAMVRSHSAAIANKLDIGVRFYPVRLGGPFSAAQANVRPNTWQWHQNQNATLAGEPDARLRFWAARRTRFRALVTQRRALIAAGDSVQARALDGAIVSALREADAANCLRLDRVTYCDWAPDDLLPQFEATMAARLTGARSQCIDGAPDPAMVARGYTFRVMDRQVRTNIDPYSSAFDLMTYLNRRAAGRRYAIASLKAMNGTPDLRYRREGGDTWGNEDWAAAGYSHRIVAGLADRPLSDPDTGGLCALNPNLDAGFDAWVALFDRRFSLIEANVGFNYRHHSKALNLSILGTDVYAPDEFNVAGTADRQTLAFNIAPTPYMAEVSDSVGGCASLPLSGVPFELCADIVGTLGVTAEFTALGSEENRDRRCEPNASVRGSLRPYASVGALGTAGASLAGVGGGLYLELNLLDVALPARFDARAVTDRNLDDTRIDVSAQAELTLSSLAGEVGGYIDFPRLCFFGECVGGRYSKTFFRWPQAIEATFELLKAEWATEFSIWAEVCGAAGIECNL